MMHNQLRSIACWQMMHKVSVPEESTSCLPCRVNPMGLICTCKQARKTGICHAIVAVNHRCGKINIASELMKMGKKKRTKRAVNVDSAVLEPAELELELGMNSTISGSPQPA